MFPKIDEKIDEIVQQDNDNDESISINKIKTILNSSDTDYNQKTLIDARRKEQREKADNEKERRRGNDSLPSRVKYGGYFWNRKSSKSKNILGITRAYLDHFKFFGGDDVKGTTTDQKNDIRTGNSRKVQYNITKSNAKDMYLDFKEYVIPELEEEQHRIEKNNNTLNIVVSHSAYMRDIKISHEYPLASGGKPRNLDAYLIKYHKDEDEDKYIETMKGDGNPLGSIWLPILYSRELSDLKKPSSYFDKETKINNKDIKQMIYTPELTDIIKKIEDIPDKIEKKLINCKYSYNKHILDDVMNNFIDNEKRILNSAAHDLRKYSSYPTGDIASFRKRKKVSHRKKIHRKQTHHKKKSRNRAQTKKKDKCECKPRTRRRRSRTRRRRSRTRRRRRSRPRPRPRSRRRSRSRRR